MLYKGAPRAHTSQLLVRYHITTMKLLILTVCVAGALADVSHLAGTEKEAKIVKQELDVGVEGYQWSFETENGISAQETGALKHIDADTAAQVAQGEAQWTAPNGEKVEFQYTADENGYQAQGSHIPTPPPIPAAILRALEWIAQHPPAPTN